MATIATALPTVRTARARPLSTVAAVYILPVLLLAKGTIPFQWRFYVLIGMTALAVYLSVVRHHPASALGLNLHRLKGVFLWSVLPSVLLAGGVLLSGLPHRLLGIERLPFYLFFVFVSAPAQEFLYRSFLFAELAAARVPPFAVVIVSATLFSFMHIIYRDYMTVLVTFLAGLVWSVVVMRTKSLLAVALSHAALGALAVTLGVV